MNKRVDATDIRSSENAIREAYLGIGNALEIFAIGGAEIPPYENWPVAGAIARDAFRSS